MANETPAQKHERLQSEYQQKSDEELLDIYGRMTEHPGIAGNFVLIITIVKDELIARGLIKPRAS